MEFKLSVKAQQFGLQCKMQLKKKKFSRPCIFNDFADIEFGQQQPPTHGCSNRKKPQLLRQSNLEDEHNNKQYTDSTDQNSE